MNIRALIEKIIKNWPVKAICFVLAVMIYFFHQIALLKTNTYSVPLEVRSNGEMVVVDGLEQYKNIEVRIRTQGEKIASITEKDIKAFIDVSSFTEEGIFDFPIYVEPSEDIVQMNLDPLEISSIPGKLTLEIEKKAIKVVPLYISVFGTPSHGYKALQAKLDPPFVTLCGPSSMLDNIERMQVEPVSVEESSSLVTVEARLLNTNTYVSVLGENRVKVSIPIVSEGIVKEFSEVSVLFENLIDILAVSDDDPKVDFILEGKLLDIEKISLDDIKVFADCSFITESGTYEVPLVIEVPDGISVTEKSSDSLIITVKDASEKEGEEDATSPFSKEGSSEMQLLPAFTLG